VKVDVVHYLIVAGAGASDNGPSGLLAVEIDDRLVLEHRIQRPSMSRLLSPL
jgi:hypothetical protein